MKTCLRSTKRGSAAKQQDGRADIAAADPAPENHNHLGSCGRHLRPGAQLPRQIQQAEAALVPPPSPRTGRRTSLSVHR